MSQNETSRRRRVIDVEDGADVREPQNEKAGASVPVTGPVKQQTKPNQNGERDLRSDSRRKPPREKRSKWIVLLLVIIIIILLFIAACSAAIVAIYNNGNMGNLIGLITGDMPTTPAPAAEYVYLTPEPTAASTPTPTPTPTPEPTAESAIGEFERVLIQKGSLIEKEFIDYARMPTTFSQYSQDYDVVLQNATLTDIMTGTEYRALRMVHGYYISQYNDGESVGILDALEIDDVIKTLEYIKENHTQMRDYTETVYQASSGLDIGAFYDGSEYRLFIGFSSSDTAFIDISEIDAVIETFKGAQINLISGSSVVSAPYKAGKATPTPMPTPTPTPTPTPMPTPRP